MTSISVVIPCYNKANLIRLVVQSVLSQTSPADEIIVVDDHSTDRSVEVISELPVKMHVHEQNQGVAATRNTGFKVSSADIALFIDSDALAEPRLIETLLSVYAAVGKETGGVGGRAIECRIHSANDRWRARHANQDYGLIPHQDVPFLFGVCCSYRHEALARVNGFDPFFRENVGEDVDIGIRLHQAGYSLAYHPAGLVFHQHIDTRDSLLNCQYRWAYWNYLLQKRNNRRTWPLYGGALKRLFKDATSDLVKYRDLELFRLDWSVFQRKIAALRSVHQFQTNQKVG